MCVLYVSMCTYICANVCELVCECARTILEFLIIATIPNMSGLSKSC